MNSNNLYVRNSTDKGGGNIGEEANPHHATHKSPNNDNSVPNNNQINNNNVPVDQLFQ
jgi:hypothetical protein